MANGTIGGASLPAMVWGTVREGIRQTIVSPPRPSPGPVVMSATDAEPLMEPVGEPLPRRPLRRPRAEPGDLVAALRIVIVPRPGGRRFRVHRGLEHEGRTRHRHLVARGRGPTGAGGRAAIVAVAIGFGLVSSFDLKRLPVVLLCSAQSRSVLIVVPDYSRSSGLANVEMVIVVAVLLVGLGSIHRRRETADR